MYYCDIVKNGRKYRLSITDNESVIGVVEVTYDRNKDFGCTVYNSDGTTKCTDLYTRKRISSVAQKSLTRRTDAIKNVVKTTMT